MKFDSNDQMKSMASREARLLATIPDLFAIAIHVPHAASSFVN
jgi:hypothetical protein